jgi:hypothetical protein
MFNGKSVSQNEQVGDAGVANYVRIDNPNFSFSTANTYTSIVAALTTAAPDLVIVAQQYDLLTFIRAVNSGWPGSIPFPRFLFLTEDSSVESEVQLPNEKFAGKIDFVTWVRSAAEVSTANLFATGFRSAGLGDPADGSESLYDLFYENAYAMQIVLDSDHNSISGVNSPGAYTNSINALNAPGTLLSVGIGAGSNVQQILTTLSAHGDVDLDGASGPLEFDTMTGSATLGTPVQDAQLECIGANGHVNQSGVTFTGATGATNGSYSCL